MKLHVLAGNVVRRVHSRGARVVVVLLPRNQCSIAPSTAANLDPTGRPEVRPGELFFTCPNNAYWLTDSFGKARSLDRAFARMLASIPAAHVRHDDPHFCRRNAERFGQFVAHTERKLGTRPHGEPIAIPLSNGRTRLKRRMSNVLHRIMLLQL